MSGNDHLGRTHARWRQVDKENSEAIEVRREWMRLMGCDEDEVEEAIATDSDLELVEELKQLAAAKRLCE